MVIFMDLSGQGDGSSSHEKHGKERSNSVEQMVTSTLKSLPFEIDTSSVYHIDEFNLCKLTNGFFGDIFKAEHKKTKVTMVIKIDRSTTNEDCNIMNEIGVLRNISHPNVVRFLGICVHEDQVHLVTEYVNGGNLEELLLNHEESLDWSVRVYLARDIANGMTYLHKQRILHRDLASKNCLIKIANGARYAIVADLGLATELPDSDEGVKNVVGSPYNMAPELLRGEAYDGKADVFSYGIILCEIIGRVQADPDELPRTGAFGLDVEKFSKMIGDCPIEFLHTAICCCQLDSRIRPPFAATIKHLDVILIAYPCRPEMLYEPMPSARPQLSDLNEHNNNLSASGVSTSPSFFTPIVVQDDEEFRSRSISDTRRRSSWIAGRYKVFHTATEDLLKSTPSKLMSFFKNVIGIRNELHFSYSKMKRHPKEPHAKGPRSRAQSSSVLMKLSSIHQERNNIAGDNFVTHPSYSNEAQTELSLSTSCPGTPGPVHRLEVKDSSQRRHTIAPLSSRRASSDLHLDQNIDDTDFPNVSPRSACSESVSYCSDFNSAAGSSSVCASTMERANLTKSCSDSRLSVQNIGCLSDEEQSKHQSNITLICSQIKTPHLDRSRTYSVIDAETTSREQLEKARDKDKADALSSSTPTTTKSKRRIRSPLSGLTLLFRNRNKGKDSE